MWFIWYHAYANHGYEFTRKWNIRMRTSNTRTNAMHSWIRYGQFSNPYDVDVFLDNAACAIRSTYHTVLKASPGAAIFGRDMLFDIPFIADWHKIGDWRQVLTNHGNQWENAKRIDYDYKVGDKVLVINEGILCKAESAYGKMPWTITTVHMNGTIRIQRRTKTKQLSIRRVEPFTDKIL